MIQPPRPIPTPTTRLALLAAAAAVSALPAPARAAAVNYRIERIASNLNQPTFLTQAPGDPANILYFSERTVSPNATFGANSAMGKVYRYDVNTRAATPVLDLSSRTLTQDCGLLGFAFSPDFNAVGTPGYQKLYVASAQTGGPTAVNRVEEYTLSGGSATFSKTILQYNNAPGSLNNHTVDWIGFNPAATGAARNYLHITTGDGSYDLPNRPSQDLTDVRGKMLRVDVAGPDAYAGDANKNFAIPPTNPIPAGGTAHPTFLGEIYLSGLRNPWRASFDRANGDLYIGDVGEVSAEELNFLKAGTSNVGTPVDFGWPQREGTGPGDSPGPSVGSINPIRTRVRSTGDRAVTAGYVYRGPISELQGKFIYGDFVTQKMFTLDFDRNTLPSTFDGERGLFADETSFFNSLIIDPTDPSYTAANAGELFGFDHIVSFGEDNAGNLYVVDFGYGAGFGGQYPPAGRGEIFRFTPIPEPASVTMLALTAGAAMLRRRRAN